MKKILFVAASLLASFSQAAIVWDNGNKILSVAYYWDGSNDVVEVVLERAVTTTCSGMTTTNKVSYWVAGSVTAASQIRYSNAVAASTTGAPVDVRYDNGICDGRYGASFHGVRHRAITP